MMCDGCLAAQIHCEFELRDPSARLASLVLMRTAVALPSALREVSSAPSMCTIPTDRLTPTTAAVARISAQKC